jgi:hypothetical protein
MSMTSTRGGLNGRLASHFAMSAAAAMGIAAASASAQVVYSGVQNINIPSTTAGVYLNVITGQTGLTSASTPGWDVNPWQTTTLGFFNPSSPTGGVYARVNTTTAGVSNLAANTPIGPSTLWTSGTAQTTGTNPFSFNSAANIVGFRFTNENGNTVHYGWMRIQLSGSLGAQPRTLVEWAFEATPNTPILAGDTGGPPPAYDPCASFNPTLQIGTNNVAMNQDTAGNLTLSGCGGTAFKANYFKFTPALSATYTFTTCASGAATRMAIMAGCEAGSAQLACNDNFCGNSSSVALAMSAGQSYYIVVGAETASATLPSPLAIAVEAPADPRCASAFPVQFGSNSIDTVINDGSVTVRSSATLTSIIHGAGWYRFVPSVTGAYTFSVCGSVGDTKMALAAACPGIGQTFNSIAYNDDSCLCSSGCGTTTQSAFSSRLNFNNTGIPLTEDLQAGQTYYLLVGGFGATTGPISAILEIDGPPPSNCPADLDGDGIVGGLDLSALLASWGQGSNGDVDGDGDTDGGDLTALLAAWGTNGC